MSKKASIASKVISSLKNKETRDYFMSTHFWGPTANFAIPLAGIADFRKDPKIISGPMTLALLGYACTFMRFSLRVQPRNMLMFACQFMNFSVQSVQGVRFLKYTFLEKQKVLQ